MRAFYILICLFCFTIQVSYAQETGFKREPSTTRYIKDIYDYVNEKITSNKYYLNEFKVNSTNLLWVDAEAFQNDHLYYYSFVGDATPVIRLIKIVTKVANKNYLREYLYNNQGDLILYHEKQNDKDKYAYREFEAYFDKGLCINILIENEPIQESEILKHKEKYMKVVDQGDIFHQKFLSDMQEENQY